MNIFTRVAFVIAVLAGFSSAAAFSNSGDAASATSTSPVKVYKIGGDVKAPELVAGDVAIAPAHECEGSMAGKVVLSTIIDATGRARNIIFIHPLGNSLDKLVLAILSAERFKPGEKDGAPVVTGVSVQVRLDGCFTADGDRKLLRLRSQPEMSLSRWPDAPEEAIFTEAAPSKDATPYGVGGNVKPPVPLVMAQPKLTDPTKKAKYEGEVMVTLMVDEQGMPQNPRVVRPLGMGLDEKALETVMLYRFKPAMQNGRRPVPVLITVPVKFQLN